MSSQRGNVKRKSQKHQNAFSFKNDMHDKSGKMQLINNLNLGGLCARCKEIIDWKIKYKKYKPLTVPKKCIKCQQKRIKQAYYTVCSPCIKELKICGKCGHKEDQLDHPEMSEAEKMSQESQFQAGLQMLPERKRRTFVRHQEQGKLTEENLNVLERSLEDEFYDEDSNDDEDETGLSSESDETEKSGVASSERTVATEPS